jgi:hypothetical protein
MTRWVPGERFAMLTSYLGLEATGLMKLKGSTVCPQDNELTVSLADTFLATISNVFNQLLITPIVDTRPCIPLPQTGM